MAFRMRRIPALDGLRALAVAMVISYHVDDQVVPAGFWGVMVFFVLSGYLLTRVLCSQRDQTGRVQRAAFYRRRGARMYPALLLLCLATLMATNDVGWASVAATLGLYANYARIDGLDLGLLTHMWFLAVIAHFYLVWPSVIAALAPVHRRRVIGGLLLVAVVWRAIAIEVMSPGWVYNATDTNAAAFLAGSYLAVARPAPSKAAGWSIPALLGLMLVPVFGVDGEALFWGGFIAIGLGVLAVQYALTGPRWLEPPVVVWIGTISYGIYLWHYVLLRSDIPMWSVAPLTAAASAASWYLLEKPLRRWVISRESSATSDGAETDGREAVSNAAVGGPTRHP